MSTTTTKSSFWQGLRDGLPFILVIVPFSALFGVVATEAGLNVYETLAFSVVVIAGAAQFTAVQLMMDNKHQDVLFPYLELLHQPLRVSEDNIFDTSIQILYLA